MLHYGSGNWIVLYSKGLCIFGIVQIKCHMDVRQWTKQPHNSLLAILWIILTNCSTETSLLYVGLFCSFVFHWVYSICLLFFSFSRSSLFFVSLSHSLYHSFSHSLSLPPCLLLPLFNSFLLALSAALLSTYPFTSPLESRPPFSHKATRNWTEITY